MNKTVFITYSWDNDDHKEWVRTLADKLIINGIETLLDQYDIQPGESFTHFMESSISKSDKVLVILTPNYRDKSLERKGGVGYEQQIISGEIMSGVNRMKFIPIIRAGKYETGDDCAIPPHFMGISIIDFRPSLNEENLEHLLRTIYQEPKLVKPTLGIKPDFKKKESQPSFVIEIDKGFNCLQPETLLTDIFLQISDLRKTGTTYKIEFDIEQVSEKHSEYLTLLAIQNPTESEIEKKLQIRGFLNDCFFFTNGTLYDYLEYSINSIIDLSFNKFKYIHNMHELFTSLTKCIKLFSDQNGWKSNMTKFDVFHNIIKWDFTIWVSTDEIKERLSKFKIGDKVILQGFAGLDIYDLSHETLINEVIPKESYKFTNDYFSKRITEDIKEKCFKIGDWRIGIS